MNFVLGVLIFLGILNANEIRPMKIVTTSSPILDMIGRNGLIWAASEDGKILQISAKGKILSTYAIPPFITLSGETRDQKAMTIDLSPDRTKVAVGTEDGSLYIFQGIKRSKTSFKTKGVIKKIVFITNDEVVLALLSSELVWFNLKQNRIDKMIAIGSSPLSDMAVSKNLSYLVTVGEAGIVRLINSRTKKVENIIHGGNVDNIYKVDYQHHRIITAGQDRRVIVYSDDGKKYQRFDGSFLVYSAALSPSGERFAAPMDEENRLSFFDIASKQEIALGKGHDATLNRIVFMDERHLISSADENKILFWEIP